MEKELWKSELDENMRKMKSLLLTSEGSGSKHAIESFSVQICKTSTGTLPIDFLFLNDNDNIYNPPGVLETVQSIVEHGMVAFFQDLGNGGLARETLLLEVFLGIVEAVLVLSGVGAGSDPNKDLVLDIQNKDIARIQKIFVDLGTRSLLCEDELSAGVAQAVFFFYRKKRKNVCQNGKLRKCSLKPHYTSKALRCLLCNGWGNHAWEDRGRGGLTGTAS